MSTRYVSRSPDFGPATNSPIYHTVNPEQKKHRSISLKPLDIIKIQEYQKHSLQHVDKLLKLTSLLDKNKEHSAIFVQAGNVPTEWKTTLINDDKKLQDYINQLLTMYNAELNKKTGDIFGQLIHMADSYEIPEEDVKRYLTEYEAKHQPCFDKASPETKAELKLKEVMSKFGKSEPYYVTIKNVEYERFDHEFTKKSTAKMCPLDYYYGALDVPPGQMKEISDILSSTEF
jgi:hypothetical protein